MEVNMTNVAIEKKIGMLSAEFQNSLLDYLDFLLAKQARKSKTKEKWFSDENMDYLEKVTAEIDSGRASLSEHELVEV